MSEALGERERTERDGRHVDGAGHDQQGGDDRLSLGRNVLSASPLVWVALAGAVAWAVWATVTRGSSSSSQSGERAVLVSTGSGDRMVVALPCGAGSSKSGAGGTSVVLPAGSGQRVVLVPGCQGGGSSSSGGGSGSGSSGSSGSGPSALLVLPPGTPAPKPGSAPPSSARSSGGKVTSVFTAPDSARLLLVTPCQSSSGSSASSGSSKGTATPASSGHGVVLAPACSGGST